MDDFNKYYEQLLGSAKTPIDQGDAAHAFWTGTQALVCFAEEVIISVLKGILKPSKLEIALWDTYFRMYLWMSGMAKLDSPVYFQQAAA